MTGGNARSRHTANHVNVTRIGILTPRERYHRHSGHEERFVALPPDNHNHSEWSWDAFAGSMEGSCARAVELGLPSIAFTEHVDLTRWGPVPASAPSHEVSARIARYQG